VLAFKALHGTALLVAEVCQFIAINDRRQLRSFWRALHDNSIDRTSSCFGDRFFAAARSDIFTTCSEKIPTHMFSITTMAFLGRFFYTFIPIETGINTLKYSYLMVWWRHNCITSNVTKVDFIELKMLKINEHYLKAHWLWTPLFSAIRPTQFYTAFCRRGLNQSMSV